MACGTTGIPGRAGFGSWPHEPPTERLPAPGRPAPGIRDPAVLAPAQLLRQRLPLHPSLGAGIVEVPVVAYKDPLTVIMEDPLVAEEIRFCSGCLAPVGRGSATKRGATQGRCFKCGTRFSFVPPLRQGDVVGAQYQVQGCLAYGGQGWIYLAKDHNVSGRWVVLKGIIHAESPAAAAAALNEQRFLAEVQHPNIVEIYNFVWHEETRTSYIVMEYLGGPTLQDVALHHYHHTAGEPLPTGQVVAYGLEILRTFSYLHGLGLLYCDLKPSNVIQVRDRVKLIDLGGVRWQNDTSTPLIHTDGFSAPELATMGASVASDLYAVARTMAALTLNLDSTGTLVESAAHRSLDSAYFRVLAWATLDDPRQRPRSADEMAEHLAAVLIR